MTDEEFREAWHPEDRVKVDLLVVTLARVTGALMLSTEAGLRKDVEESQMWFGRADAMAEEFGILDELFEQCYEEAQYRVRMAQRS